MAAIATGLAEGDGGGVVRTGVGDGDGDGELVVRVGVGELVPVGAGVVDDVAPEGAVDGVAEVLGEGLDEEGFGAGVPRTGPMIDGEFTCTLPGARSAMTAAAATPANASPPAAAVNAFALPLRRNSVRRRSRRSVGSAARCAASELSGALR